MNTSLFRVSGHEKVSPVEERNNKKEEKIDMLIKIKKNKDNLCSSLCEIENFLCQVNKACKISHLFKFLK